jgi:hypothetical protein
VSLGRLELHSQEKRKLHTAAANYKPFKKACCIVQCIPVYLSNSLLQQQRGIYVQHNIQVRSHNHSCRGKAICITYSERLFVALFIHHTKHMRRIVLSSVVSLDLQYLSTLFHKRHDFWGKRY